MTASMLRAALDATADGLLIVDLTNRVQGYNAQFLEMWRIPPALAEAGDDEAMLRAVLEQLQTPEPFLARVRDLYATPEAESFDVLQFRDGRVYERYSRPQRLEGRVVGRVWSFRDVTGRVTAEVALRESQLRLLQAQKMEVVGRLAGGVAHDFNNLLTIIAGNAELLVERLPKGSPLLRSARDVAKAAEHAGALTRRLLAFSHNQVVAPEVVDLREVLRGSLQLLRRLLREDIELAITMAEEPLLVRIDPVQVEQVLFNLAVNARDAMPGGGRIRLSAGRDGDEVRLGVEDNGVGMDEATQSRLFEPFFTTKGLGRGTGLGLATVREIVEGAGGSIRMHSSPGGGTRALVRLPRVEAAPPAAGAVVANSPRTGALERILVVEDAPDLRELIAEILTHAGYAVSTAGDGAEALVLGTREQPALVVTDVVLPRLSGPELARRLRGVRPELKVLLISGYAEATGAPWPAGARHLSKPFRVDALLSVVRDLLDQA